MTGLRVLVVVLLAWAGYWAALPWIDCARVMYPFDRGLEFCTFGFPGPTSPGDHGPLWTNLLVGLFYVAAAAFLGIRPKAF